MTEERKAQEQIGGIISSERPCVFAENGKHDHNQLTFRHFPNALFWIPFCHYCGFVDTQVIHDEYVKPLLAKERESARRESAERAIRAVEAYKCFCVKELGYETCASGCTEKMRSEVIARLKKDMGGAMLSALKEEAEKINE